MEIQADNSTLSKVPCPFCNNSVNPNSTRCEHCGTSFSQLAQIESRDEVSYIKAPLGERFVANVIDSLIMGVISMATFFYAWPAGIILPYLYLLVMDGLNFTFMDGRSIGKKVMNLRPVRLNGEPMDLPTSVKRNFLRLFPVFNLVDAGLVFVDEHNRRLGDKIAETIVVVDE